MPSRPFMGFDCDGKPIHQGDLVEIVKAADHLIHHLGRQCRITGFSDIDSNYLQTDIVTIFSHIVGLPRDFRVIQEPTGNWKDIEDIFVPEDLLVEA